MDSERSTSERVGSRQIAAILREEIENGDYANDPFPSYRSLRDRFGVAINTAQAAVKILEHSGHVVVRRGSGAVISDPSNRVSADKQLTDIQQRLRELQEVARQAGTVVVAIERQIADLADRIHTPNDVAE